MKAKPVVVRYRVAKAVRKALLVFAEHWSQHVAPAIEQAIESRKPLPQFQKGGYVPAGAESNSAYSKGGEFVISRPLRS